MPQISWLRKSSWRVGMPRLAMDNGASTAAPILSDEILGNDEGRIVEARRVYWYPDYAVRNEIEEVRANLVLLFQGVE